MSAASQKAPPRVLLFYRLPTTSPVSFDRLFRFEDRLTEMVLQTLSQKRNDLAAWLRSPSSAEAGMQLARDYLPHLLGLVHCIETQADLRTYAPLTYTWGQSVAGEYASRLTESTSPSVYFELTTVLMTYGYLHCNAAAELMEAARNDAEYDERTKKASSLLRTASGIFTHVVTNVWPKWPPVAGESRPPDVHPKLAEALSLLCVAQAQQLALRRAVNNRQLSRGMVAKLHLDTTAKLDAVLSVLGDVPGPLATHIRHVARIAATVYDAASKKFLGCEAYDAGQYGLSVGYLQAAQHQLQQVSVPTDVRWMRDMVDAEIAETNNIAAVYVKENSAVYFEKVPPVESLPVAEPRALITGGITFTPPPAHFTEIK